MIVEQRKHIHIAHRNHIIDLLDPKPMQDVWHKPLESHILHACDELCRFEIFVRRVTAPFPKVVH